VAEELNLQVLREEIDRLDEEIVRLLVRRARCAAAIGRYKHARGMPIYEPQREATVIARVKALSAALEGPLDADAIGRLYERIMDEARRIQRTEAKHAPATGADEAGARE
jgi:chorismate mutase